MIPCLTLNYERLFILFWPHTYRSIIPLYNHGLTIKHHNHHLLQMSSVRIFRAELLASLHHRHLAPQTGFPYRELYGICTMYFSLCVSL